MVGDVVGEFVSNDGVGGEGEWDDDALGCVKAETRDELELVEDGGKNGAIGPEVLHNERGIIGVGAHKGVGTVELDIT